MFDQLQLDPVAFTIPIGDGFEIYWYAILITVGIAIGTWWAGREIEKRGEDPDNFFNGLILTLIAGFLFARLWYVFQDIFFAGNSAGYPTFGSIINIRAGGANILGGFVGAALVAITFLNWKKLPKWDYADVAGPALLIAQGIGRWGNFINQELYGPPTNSSWGLLIDVSKRIPPFNDLTEYGPLTRFHPTFLYESVWLLVGAGLLLWLNNKYRESWKPGTLFGCFMLWWGFGRAWVELFRTDQPLIGESAITYSMILSLMIAFAGLLFIMNRFDKLGLSAESKRARRRVRKPKRRDQ